jgi:hypothetical protein
MPRREKKYNFIYKTTCFLTKRYYYGMHSTNNLKDNYLGSGSELSKSIKKYGKENHIIKRLEFFDNRKKLKKRESKIINESLLQDPLCMNLSKGGTGSNYACDLVTVKDKDGNNFDVYKNDPRYLSRELVGINKGMVLVKNNDKIIRISINDPRYLSGELKHIFNNTIVVKNKIGKILSVDKNDPRYLSGKLVGVTKGRILVKDKNGNRFYVLKNNLRYLNKELKYFWVGKKHSEETKGKIGLKNSIKQKGKKNSQFGTCWITNETKNKKIKRNESIPNGWRLGRKIIN